MMTVSVCMIVKNEEQTLGICLASLKDIADEIIVVDTGSDDRTKEIAASFHAKIFDLPWTDDFAAARNHAFSLATGDYIYSADADEELDAENREKFLKLKADLSDGTLDADIVQFFYAGQLSQNSVYNYDREYRPKLFKRVRSFVWEGAVHEQVRLDPVVFDSDIEIMHRPHGQHAERDLRIFSKMAAQGSDMPARLVKLYARELFIAGTDSDIAEARAFFAERVDFEDDGDAVEAALLVLLRAARVTGDEEAFLKYAVRILDGGMKSSEFCVELGRHYLDKNDAEEALIWFLAAAEQEEPSLDIRTGGMLAYRGAAESFRHLGNEERAGEYEKMAESEERK
ncbi:MAG: glycosyltransferase family 2 protein [Lachnospiraceae bacterium]|nr:glycosyltransferase family 2 protein [Lachnospiraceae bacterium]